MNSRTVLGILTVIFVTAMLTATAVSNTSAQTNIVNPNPPAPTPAKNTTNNLPALLLGCKDGIVIFLGNGLNMGCAVAPFHYKAFNGVDIKTVNNGTTPLPPVKNNTNIGDNILYNTFVKYCNGLKSPQKDPICKLFVIGKGK